MVGGAVGGGVGGGLVGGLVGGFVGEGPGEPPAGVVVVGAAVVGGAVVEVVVGATVVVVNAHVPGQSEMRPGYLERLRERRADELRQWCGDLLDEVPSSMEIVDGDPRDVLREALDRHSADLLVVASAGHRSRGPGFLHVGSVVEYLAHHLEHPLAVITPGAEPTVDRIVIGISRRKPKYASPRPTMA